MSPLIRILCAGIFASSAHAEPDWSSQATVPVNGRANPYELPAESLPRTIRQGRVHALNYPVSASGILLPYRPIKNFLEAGSADPLRRLLEQFAARLSTFSSFDDLERWLGLHEYPTDEGSGPYHVPYANGERPAHRMGFTLVETPRGTAFTVGCAQCHSANLFGRRVIGLTNRFPRANAFFDSGLRVTRFVSPGVFQWSTGASANETEMFKDASHAMSFVGARRPIQLGLDTSLAQVALSLARRDPTPWAERRLETPVRPSPLAWKPADSKPAVWWNLKYKTRWLSDGSVVSGNPIFTNFLWNEIGRGVDLRVLDDWFAGNEAVVRELTTAVFASEPPPWTDFFPASSIDEGKARRGEKAFERACSRCHGHYEKAWSLPTADAMTPTDRLRTVNVRYKFPTPVMDVGTDPARYLGMKALTGLNDLEISHRHGIRIEPQKGYVPPPLVGIWARWPYFHNNSAPNLCAVLTPAKDRPVTYWAREAVDPVRDFDQECVGYPIGSRPPRASTEFFFDTRRPGLRNTGHDERILFRDGREVLTAAEKKDLIEFLKTL